MTKPVLLPHVATSPLANLPSNPGTPKNASSPLVDRRFSRDKSTPKFEDQTFNFSEFDTVASAEQFNRVLAGLKATSLTNDDDQFNTAEEEAINRDNVVEETEVAWGANNNAQDVVDNNAQQWAGNDAQKTTQNGNNAQNDAWAGGDANAQSANVNNVQNEAWTGGDANAQNQDWGTTDAQVQDGAWNGGDPNAALNDAWTGGDANGAQNEAWTGGDANAQNEAWNGGDANAQNQDWAATDANAQNQDWAATDAQIQDGNDGQNEQVQNADLVNEEFETVLEESEAVRNGLFEAPEGQGDGDTPAEGQGDKINWGMDGNMTLSDLEFEDEAKDEASSAPLPLNPRFEVRFNMCEF